MVFGQAALPPPPLSELLNRLTAGETVEEESYQVVRYMDLAVAPCSR
jgi:hypothetical protein